MKLSSKLIQKRLDRLPAVTPQIRDAFVSILMQGTAFNTIKNDLKLARTERGEEINYSAIYLEYLQVLLDYRVPKVICGGCAQIGKSLFAVLAYSYTTSKFGLNTLFLFPQEQSMQKIVPVNHKPIINQWEQSLYPNYGKRDISNLQTYRSGSGATFNYSYFVNKIAGNDGAAASSSIVSISVDALFVDEVSQYPKGAIEMASRRLDASRIPSQPIRLLGTAGNGGGIERYIKEATHQFYPSVVCESCSKVAFLDPYGALLKASLSLNADGTTKKSYLTTTGRPDSWHSTSDKAADKIQSATICCIHCNAVINDSNILNARFRERHSNLLLTDYLATYTTNTSDSISVELSPLLRGNKRMAALIQEGLTTASPTDWVQQSLGKPSEFSATSIDMESIGRAFGHKPPTIKKSNYEEGMSTIVMAGIDQGHSSDAVAIIRYYYDNTEENANLQRETACREFIYFGAVARQQIPDILEHYNVEFCFMDAEPSISSAAEIMQLTSSIILADQIVKQKDDFILSTMADGGEDYPIVKIRYVKFAKFLLSCFTAKSPVADRPLYIFNNSLDWIMNVSKELSPAYHLTNINYEPETGLIKRAQNHIDHFAFATIFAESAFSYWQTHDTSNSGRKLSMSDWL